MDRRDMADNLEQEIADGKQLHRAGRLDEAKVIYQRVLNETPDNPDALHLLGVIASTQGDHQKSQDYISRAIKYAPKTLHYHNNLGLALLELGREIEAEQAFKVEIERSPNHVVALSNLGSLLQKRGCVDEALDLYLIALKYDSKNITILNNLAAAMVVSERYSDSQQLVIGMVLLRMLRETF
ncbi:tetratricopeptide repeat protein [Candidatus Reidiella endopervernicosa]|uniref:Tetratricopeptide repeat protein n=1 Tax=Candidatus Reidiella endopervernicosa TaxID=2738883 RepID=A0A6N0HUI9_9GAMM|nr:tetratricopeptide repeat protein [Candidatus Reidiella endopervernicosa]QKQ25871.1 tetratricopeptide repeat protein [Candidatus Reidiella endopervernicosa]